MKIKYGFVYFAIWTAIALMIATQSSALMRLIGYPVNLMIQVRIFLIWSYTWAFLGLATRTMLARFPLKRENLARNLPLHLIFMAAASFVLHPLLYLVADSILSPQITGSFYGTWKLLVMNHAGPNAIAAIGILSAFSGIQSYQERRDLELQASELKMRLSQARFMALRAQLEPHFLFNCLASASSLVSENTEAAKEMLADLGDLLRSNLRDFERSYRPLQDELEFANTYLQIQKQRFGDFDVFVAIPTEAASWEVPTMLLQPLIENAVIHGVSRSSTAPRFISIRARVIDKRFLEVQVVNSGCWEHEEHSQAVGGLGIKNLKERLEIGYKGSGGLRITRQQKTVSVEVTIPDRSNG